MKQPCRDERDPSSFQHQKRMRSQPSLPPLLHAKKAFWWCCAKDLFGRFSSFFGRHSLGSLHLRFIRLRVFLVAANFVRTIHSHHWNNAVLHFCEQLCEPHVWTIVVTVWHMRFWLHTVQFCEPREIMQWQNVDCVGDSCAWHEVEVEVKMQEKERMTSLAAAATKSPVCPRNRCHTGSLACGRPWFTNTN